MIGKPPGGGRLIAAVAGGAAARLTWTLLPDRGIAWRRPNFRDRDVSLAGGPALAVGAATGVAVARAEPRLVALIGGVGAVGLVDDLWGHTHARGLRGHLRALRGGTVTTGMVKLVTGAVLAFALSPRARRSQSLPGRLRDVVVIAGSANLVNLFDLRPGRALKVSALGAAGLLGGAQSAAAAGLLGAVGAVAGPDLSERAMIGDCGANAAGAAIGWLAVDSLSPPGRWLAAALVTVANLASERISFSAVIATHPLLRRFDQVGRRE